jgi:hypothetical protein
VDDPQRVSEIMSSWCIVKVEWWSGCSFDDRSDDEFRRPTSPFKEREEPSELPLCISL